MTPRPRWLLWLLIPVCLLLAAACGDGGAPSSFGSSKIEAVPTNVSGAGSTSGISAGAALSAPSSGGAPSGSATPTPTPTATPAPSK